jgi:hypothetical protein
MLLEMSQKELICRLYHGSMTQTMSQAFDTCNFTPYIRKKIKQRSSRFYGTHYIILYYIILYYIILYYIILYYIILYYIILYYIKLVWKNSSVEINTYGYNLELLYPT